MSNIYRARVYVHGGPWAVTETIYLCIMGATWGGTELHFWQAFLWPYYAITGVIWQ